MKWIGWIVFAIFLITCLYTHESNQRETRLRRQNAETRLAEQTQTVQAILSQAREGLPNLERKLEADQNKVKEYEASKAKHTARKTELERQIEQLTKSIERLQDDRSTAQDQRRESITEIRKVQARIAQLEKTNAIIFKALETVTEQVGM